MLVLLDYKILKYIILIYNICLQVVDQCLKYVWLPSIKIKPASFNENVNVTLYYETLCPFCRQFISTQLSLAYEAVGSIMNIVLVPYGNAKELYRPETKLYQYYCQHGSDECYGNLYHSCLITLYSKTADHLPVIRCMESNDKDDVDTAGQKCVAQSPLSMEKISDCMNSEFGNAAQHQMAVLTGNTTNFNQFFFCTYFDFLLFLEESLNPPHQYVPWIVVNGVHSDDVQNQAEQDLIKLVCDTYNGVNKPAACNQSPKLKRSYID